METRKRAIYSPNVLRFPHGILHSVYLIIKFTKLFWNLHLHEPNTFYYQVAVGGRFLHDKTTQSEMRRCFFLTKFDHSTPHTVGERFVLRTSSRLEPIRSLTARIAHLHRQIVISAHRFWFTHVCPQLIPVQSIRFVHGYPLRIRTLGIVSTCLSTADPYEPTRIDADRSELWTPSGESSVLRTSSTWIWCLPSGCSRLATLTRRPKGARIHRYHGG